MADIDRDEVVRIAELAHLTLGEEELDRMTRELGAILRYVKQLEEADIEGVPPTAHVVLDALRLRADVAVPSLDRDVALSQAPATRAGSFRVPAFVDEG